MQSACLTQASAGARNSSIDCLKGIAILLVVWGHCIQYLFVDTNQDSFFVNPLFVFIYSFHMPLFMAVSGYLFASSVHRHSKPELLQRRVKQLLVPAVTWSVATSIMVYLVQAASGHARLVVPHNVLWFLTALLFCTLVAIACDLVCGGHPAVYVLAVTLSLALPDYFELSYDKFMLPYFVGGILFFRYAGRISNVQCILVWTISAIAFAVLLAHWKTEEYIYVTGMSLYVLDRLHRISVIGYRFAAGAVGIIFILGAVHAMQRVFKTTPLVRLGKYSMGIYVLSMPVNPLLQRLKLPHSNLLTYDCVITPIASAMLAALCVLATKVIQRNRTADVLLLGGR